MADPWASDEEQTNKTSTTTTTATNNTNNDTNNKPKKKRKKRRKKKASQNTSQSTTANSSPQKKKAQPKDEWDVSSEDEFSQPKKAQNNPTKQTKQDKKQKNKPKPKFLADASKSSKKPKDTEILDSDDDSNDKSTTIDNKTKGLYPIWRPEQNYKYCPKVYQYQTNYIQRDEILLKLKRKQTFEGVMHAFEKKNNILGCQSFANLDRELLEVYGINIYNNLVPIYENIGDDNHRPFMIDLDSLLLDIFSSPLIRAQLKYGPRLLPIVYILNNYLDLLFCGGRSAQIIIFKCNKHLWKYSIHYYMRTYIVYYLLFFWQIKQQKKYDIKYDLVLEFDSFWDIQFSNYIYQYLPVFALIVRPDNCPFIAEENRYLLLYLTFYLIASRIPCVQNTEVTFSSNALYGFTIDVPANIEKYILSKFRLSHASSKPIKLKPLLQPITVLKEYAFDDGIFTNLNFIDDIANDSVCKSANKRNVSRLSFVYGLISMFRDCEITPFQWDFIRLILLQLVISENETVKNECRQQVLPAIAIEDTGPQSEKTKNDSTSKDKEETGASSWVDLDSDFSDSFGSDKSESEEIKSEEKEEEKKENFDFEKVIRECWWYKIKKWKENLNIFMNHCTVFLSQYLSEFEEIKSKFMDSDSAKDVNMYGHFDCESFSDSFDFRIFCYLISAHNRLIGGKNKKLKNKPRKWLENEKKIISNLGLNKEEMRQFSNLYNIVTSEIGGSIPKIYPIIQSKYLLNIGFKKEFDDNNRSVVQCDSIKNDYVRIEGDVINILMGDLERELDEKGLLYYTNKVTGLKERNTFFRKYEWVKGGAIPDGITPWVYKHRTHMVFQTFIAKYAQSLEGGKVVLRDVIVSKKKETQTDTDNDTAKNYHKKKYKKDKSKIDVKVQAALEVRARERELKLQKVANLIRVCKTMYNDLEMRITRLDEELQETNDPIAALPGLTQLHEWATEAALKCNPERNIYPIVRLWQTTFDIFRRFVENVNVDDTDTDVTLPNEALIKSLQKSLHCMGFAEPARQIAGVYVDKKKGAVSLEDVLVPFSTDNIRISIGCSYARFQMEHCGPYMIRGVGSRPDPRVTGFYPDSWQVELLDIVDHRYSGLVVAPTSSGKTFVSYYCMKEILQQNKSIKNQRDKGIVVYVSPTKALTWQACADIYSKYGDVFGVLTPDYDHKPLECQVLVCVPESFEKLLMSSERIQLHKQIKYVIFDEIHCLGRSEGGAIWERLLMLIRSPFLALSATVGHPLRLKKWLNTITNVMQQRTDEYKHKCKIIQHKERWSYLEKYIYIPDKCERVTDEKVDLYVGCNKEEIGWKSSIMTIHPVGAIGLTENNNVLDVYDGFPPLTFSPSDCVALYESMCKYVEQIGKSEYRKRLNALKPDLFFKKNLYITKNQASKYEKLMKKELKAWIVGFNQKSQIIDQDVFDIKEDNTDREDIDEKLEFKEAVSVEIDTKKLSKKEKKRLEQDRKRKERESQRKKAEQERERKRQMKKQRKGGKKVVRNKANKAAETETEEIKSNNKSETGKDSATNKTEMKEEILSAKEKGNRRIIVDKLLNSMAFHTLERIERMEETFVHGQHNNDCYSFQWVLDNFINLVIELDSTDRLPTLCFVLDRVECEQLFLKLLTDLEFLEEKKKAREMSESGVTAEMEIERRRQQRKAEKLAKKLAKEKKQRDRQKKDEDNPDVNDGLDDFNGFGEQQQKDYRFTLFDRGDEMDSDDMSFWTKRLLKKTKWPLSHPLMKGLERGIGLHHEGLPLQYRQLVETLFRAKHIKLVVSVASLAMGVNMPARAVVFAGDSHMLDPLNYRQMMGRAGRRGYDNIGHVIFFGISPRKISYLMTSQLTSLNGHYPILSTTSSIRCTKLLLQSLNANEDESAIGNSAEYYTGLIKNLFHKPFNFKIPFGDNLNIIEKFRYSLDYHLQNGLLSIQNLQIDCLGDLASVLHEYEPNNFLFIKLLHCGYFHKICQGYTKLKGDYNSKLKQDILRKILLILCAVFEVHPIPISYIPKPCKSDNYLSKSFLALPEQKLLDKELFEIIDRYKYNFISHYYNMYYTYNKAENINNIFGSENTINYIEYYLKYCDGGIFGNNQIFLSDFRGRSLYKNAYIYDFYIHEDYKRIVDEASLRDGLAWRKLKKFQLLLSIINKSLRDVSSLKTKQELINEEVKGDIEKFENSLQKLRQHKFSIYRRQQQFWMDLDGKLWKKHEIEAYKNKLRLQAIGDDFVMAFQDLNKDFAHKFKNIVPIGPIASYNAVINQAQQIQQQTTDASIAKTEHANSKPTTTTTTKQSSLPKKTANNATTAD